MKTYIYTPEQKTHAVELVKAGNSVSIAAEMTGVGRITIYKKIRQECPEILVQNREAKKEYKARISAAARKPRPVRDNSAIIALYSAGFNREKIEQSLGVSEGAVSKAIQEFRVANPEFDTPKVLARLERDKRICELRNTGKTYKDIGKIVGMSEGGVCGVCSKYGLTHAAKRARKDNGEIPQEILTPLVEYMRKFISAEFAEKVENLAKNMVA